MPRYNKLLASSIDAEKLSLTVRGIIVGAIPAIVFIARYFDVDLPDSVLVDLADAVSKAILAVGTAISASMVVMGVVRKVAIYLGLMKGPQSGDDNE